MGYKLDLVSVDAESLVSKFVFVEGVVYKVDGYGFNYVLATHTTDSYVCDCFPCTKKGNVLKGYEYPIPIMKDTLLGAVFND